MIQVDSNVHKYNLWYIITSIVMRIPIWGSLSVRTLPRNFFPGLLISRGGPHRTASISPIRSTLFFTAPPSTTVIDFFLFDYPGVALAKDRPRPATRLRRKGVWQRFPPSIRLFYRLFRHHGTYVGIHKGGHGTSTTPGVSLGYL